MLGSAKTNLNDADKNNENKGLTSLIKKWWGSLTLTSSPEVAPSPSSQQSSQPRVDFAALPTPTEDLSLNHPSSRTRRRSNSVGRKEGMNRIDRISRKEELDPLPGSLTPRRKRQSLTTTALNIINPSEALKELEEISDVILSKDPMENCKQLFITKKIGTFIKIFNAISEEDLIRYINEQAGKEGIKFLQEFQKKIFSYAKITDTNLPLKDLDKGFKELLIKKGLTRDLHDGKYVFSGFEPENFFAAISAAAKAEIKEIFQDKPYHVPLAETIYILCAGLNNPERSFDAEAIRHATVGLMSKYPSIDILEVLYQIFQSLNKAHQLVAIFILKEMLMWDEFHHIHRTISLADSPIKDVEIKEALAQLIERKKQKEKSLFQIGVKINAILARSYSCYTKIVPQNENDHFNRKLSLEKLLKKSKSLDNLVPGSHYSSKMRANHLRAMTLHYYQTLNFNEFATEVTDSGKAARSDRCRIFNVLSNYVIVDILNQSSVARSIAKFGTYIRTMAALLEGNQPDLNSAMMLSSAMNSYWISSLHFLAEGLSKEDKNKLKFVEERVSVRNNYAEHQKLMKEHPFSLPYVGLYSRYITFGGENTFLYKCEAAGKVYLEMMQRQDSLKETYLPIEPALYALVQLWNVKDDDRLKCLTQRLINKPFILDPTTTIAGLEAVFIYFSQHKDLKLAFSYDGETAKDDEDSVRLLFKWLDNYFQENDTTITLKVVNEAIKCFGHDLVYKHELLFTRNQQEKKTKQITVQYEREKTHVKQESRSQSFSSSEESLSEQDAHPPMIAREKTRTFL